MLTVKLNLTSHRPCANLSTNGIFAYLISMIGLIVIVVIVARYV